MKLKYAYVLLLLTIFVTSCSDDDGPQLEVVPPRALSEVALENDNEIQVFLQSHFYNYEEFQNPSVNFDYKIVIDTISGENSGKTPLSEQVVTKTIKVSSFEFLLDGAEEVEHKYYYLEAREGQGNKPSIADSVFVNYQGSLLDGTVFDEIGTGTWWINPSFQFPLQAGSAKGFRGVGEGVTNTAGGVSIMDNNDGTFEVDGSGIGMIIIPSGLANFNSPRGIIPSYSPVIFKYEVLTVVEDTDHDNDGIPSILEDVNMNDFLPDDNTDNDSIANFQDTDDDNDGIPTREEIDLDADGNFVGFRDTDGDGVPDHLDNDL